MAIFVTVAGVVMEGITTMDSIQDTIQNTKDRLPDFTPTPPGLHEQATAHELKSRLDWGEPALSILDVRDRATYNDCHIRGAMSMPMDTLVTVARFSLRPNRDIYVYGNSDEETANAANMLRSAGFHQVAELKGSLQAWRAIGGFIEGSKTNESPGPGAYNLGSRLGQFATERSREKQMK